MAIDLEIPPSDPAEYLAWMKRRRRAGHGVMPGLVRVSSVKTERVRWLWPGRIPRGKLTIIDGDPGVGKSTLACDIIARATTGGRWPDGGRAVHPGGALMLAAEDGLRDTTRPRLEAAGADLDRVVVLNSVPGADGGQRAPVLPMDLGVLEAIITAERVIITTIDVVSEYLDSSLDMNGGQSMRRALAALHAVAESTGSAIIGFRHLNKQGGVSNPLYRGSGSISITGRARAVHLCGIDPDDPNGERRVFAPVKVNVARKMPPLAYQLVGTSPAAKIEWSGAAAHSAEELLGVTLGADERAERDEVVWWIQGYLNDREGNTAPFSEIRRAAHAIGIPERTLKAARTRAGVEFARLGYQGGTAWRLPDSKAPIGAIGAIRAAPSDPGPDGPDAASIKKPGRK